MIDVWIYRVYPLQIDSGGGFMDKATLNQQVRLFSLHDQHGTLITSEDLLKHRYVVLYFYPKDNTAG